MKLKENLITDEKYYLNRRDFIKSGVLGTISLTIPELFAAGNPQSGLMDFVKNSQYGKDLTPHSFKQISSYNNFYEFGIGKRDPQKNAHTLKTKPWHIKVSGECKKTGNFDLEDFIKPQQLEERIYRFRCVEAWSMVIPWLGISLANVLKSLQPTSKAKFVKFTTLLDPKQMPGQNSNTINWAYTEGLTIAEAMNPLSFLAVGLYGKQLPNQNGDLFAW